MNNLQPILSKEERFERLVARCRSTACAVWRKGFPGVETEEVFSIACAKAWFHFDEMRAEEAFKVWFIQIGKNVCVDKMRGKKFTVSIEDVKIQDSFDVAQDAERKEFVEMLRSRMRPSDFDILWNHIQSQNSVQESAIELGLTECTFKGRLHQAKKRARELCRS